MKNSTLIEILKTFTGEEFKKFEDFSQSSYFTKNTNIIKLVHHLKILSPRFEDEAVSKENIWKALFGDKKFNYGVLKNIVYETGKIVNMFMSVEIFMKKDLKIKLNHLEFLSMKGLSVQMEKGIRSLKSELAEMNVSNEYFYINSKLEMIEKGNLEVYLKTKKKDFGDYSSFNKYFISYFFSNFFLANNKGLLVSAVYDKDNQNEDLRRILKFYEKEYKGNDILSMFFYYSIRLNLESENRDLYHEVKSFIFRNFEEFDRRTKYNSCIHLLRFCSRFTLNDDTEFAGETFEVIKFMLSNNVYKAGIGRLIDHSLYYMAVDIAVQLNETGWCENFIKDFKDKLNPAVRENYVNLSMMLLNRSQKNFTGSLEYLSNVIPDSSLVKLTIKEFELKNFYDLGYYEEIYSLIKNNKNFSVNDRTFSKSALSSFNNLMKYLKNLLDIKLSPKNGKFNLYKLEKLSSEIQDKNIFNKSWLMNILDNSIKEHSA